ncbi:alpha/beta hydrolase [Cytophaga sp. FL35]|uniref:alpha/beta fold hydrolase n=1 Tax=Cytophaga sp. FL35 TaxID=1904456 RepID=UPI0016538109|nr:alpha/beta hydrolase [Cytophaga sp. FL35]MBC6998537.1 alpha/beta hydrolase [Cytophaga sp. FL35]
MRLIILISACLVINSCTDKFSAYRKVPDYITKASSIDSLYYEAYDQTMNLWNVDYEELYIPTTDGIAHVLVSGPKNREPVVLLHGMNASSTMWYPNIQALSENYRVFAIDFLLEPGKSKVYDEVENVEKAIDWYEEVLFVLELDNFHLVGASRGGWMAVNLAFSNQKRIKSMILLSPAQTFTWIRPSKDLFKNIVKLFSSKEKRIEQTLESMSTDVTHIENSYIQQYKLGLETDSENEFILSMRPFSTNKLQTLQMPVLVLIGDDDIINESKTVKIANTLPKGKGEIINNAGHFLSMDQAEEVNKRMLEFLDK